MPEKSSSIRRTARTTEVNSNERQERRKTDRHSRSGYKQDGEKKMNGGKGSWGKAVVSSEQHVSVVESVAIADGEIVEVEGSDEGGDDVVVVTEPVTPPQITLTLAQYQATLKKSVQPANVTRKLSSSSVSNGEILKKESEVFVFPEIVKKSVVHVPIVKKVSSKKTEIDVSKYISVKTVGSLDNGNGNGNYSGVEQQKRFEKEKGNRSERSERSPRTSDRNSRTSTTSTPTPTASPSKLNLKDDRSFPSLGSK